MTGGPLSEEGQLPGGVEYLINVPGGWNGTLLLYSHGPPRSPGTPAWPRELPVMAALLDRGYAVAGCATRVFYPLEQNLPAQARLLEACHELAGEPARVIALGESIGGLMTAASVQVSPPPLAGALALCGPLAGGVAHWNQDLDCSFVFKTLIAPDSGLELVNITRPGANLRLAHTILDAARGTGEGRARLALAAAVRQVPGWFDPGSPAPARDDLAARGDNQAAWLRWIVLLVALSAREVLERRAGGNPSWNTGVDYAALLERSGMREEVLGQYRMAGLSLEADLSRLASAERISAEPAAVRYYTRYIAFNGHLGGVPVLTLHTTGDGLVPAAHMHAYADVVRWAGHDAWLRQLYVERAGHCTYTPAEVVTALTLLERRVESGKWPVPEAGGLNEDARALGEALNRVTPEPEDEDWGAAPPGLPAAPAFTDFRPGTFTRPYDVRDAELQHGAG